MSFYIGQKWKNKSKRLVIEVLHIGERNCWIRYNDNPATDCWRKKEDINRFYFPI